LEVSAQSGKAMTPASATLLRSLAATF